MFKFGSLLIGLSLSLFASFSSSTNYQLKSYSIGPGGTNNAASSTYHAQANVGEVSATSNSTTYTARSGAVQAEQLNVPEAPTLFNGNGTYYNELKFTLNFINEPSDATYAIAVSTNNFTTTYYVQATGALGSTPLYQSYTAWGGSSGSYMVGLANSTTYEAKVAAMEGQFSNTEFGPAASAATTAPSISFSVSPNSVSIGALPAGSVVIGSTDITASLTTDAEAGANVFVSGKYGGLNSSTDAYTIAGITGNLSSLSEGFGLQGVSTSTSSGGPLSLLSPYNGSGNNVGIDSTVSNPILTTPDEVQSGVGTIDVQAKSANTDPAGSDYQEQLTFSAAASF